jgi:hypothetical protein
MPGRPLLLGAGVVAAAVVTLALALPRSESPSDALPLGPLSALGRLREAPPPGAPGPEGVPIPAGHSLASPGLLQLADRIDGIACESGEEVALHIHAHVRIVVRGRSRQLPAGLGIGAGGTCFMWLHTHAADGIVHIESPVKRTYTLGEFFEVWGQPLSRRRVGPARGRVSALFDGRVFTGDPRTIPLLAHSQIELEIGRPLVAPERIAFPSGL